jgi:uncharacterized protein YecE (DUF72 family)
MGDLRHHHPVREPSGERRRTGGADEEATPAPPVTGLTSYPVVRYIGRDDAARTAAGWQHWLDAVADWLREGRSPTVFIHTPDNVGALELARRFQ